VELESVLDLERSSWNTDSLKPGDSVTVQGLLARDGSKQVWGNSVVLTSTNRKVLTMSPEALAALKPVFQTKGTITAGNAPGLNAGAAAMGALTGSLRSAAMAAVEQITKKVDDSRSFFTCRLQNTKINHKPNFVVFCNR